MVEKVLGLRNPIHAKVNGRECTFYTSGYVAIILQRTPWTIRWWQRKGLFPEPPFFLNPDNPRTRRGLYPEPFLEALAEIAARGYLKERLDHYEWRRFHNDVCEAYESTVTPLLDESVMQAGDLTVLRGE